MTSEEIITYIAFFLGYSLLDSFLKAIKRIELNWFRIFFRSVIYSALILSILVIGAIAYAAFQYALYTGLFVQIISAFGIICMPYGIYHDYKEKHEAKRKAQDANNQKVA